VLEALTVLFLIAGYLTILFSDDDDSVIAVPLSLFKDVNNNCHLVLDGQYQQEAGGRLSSQLTTACQCVLAATVFDGISAYLSLDMNLTQVTMDDDSYLGLYCLEAYILNNLDLNYIFIKVCAIYGSEMRKAFLWRE
jgi:hypothetical protein